MTNKFYEKTWFIVLMSFVFPPAAIILIWMKKERLQTIFKLLLTAVLGVWSFIWGVFTLAFLLVATGNVETLDNTTQIISTTEVASAEITKNTLRTEENETEPQPGETQTSTTEETVNETSTTRSTTTSSTTHHTQKPTSSQSGSSKPTTVVATTKPSHVHSFNPATCTTPKTCSCGAQEGVANGHEWKDATCQEPKTCTVCKTTTGSTIPHNWKEATYTTPKTCSFCGATSGNPLDVPGKENYHGHVYTGGSSSKKYHYEPNCAGKNSHEITWDEVERRNLGPCGTCVLN